MSWLSDRTGIHLGNVGAPIGMALGSLVGMPTLGAALGQGVGALGQGKSIGQAAVQGAGAGVGASAVGGGGGFLSGLTSKVPGLQSVTDFLGGNGGKNGLAALQGLNAAYNQQKSSGLANNALGTVQAEWDRHAPLRAQGQAQMLAPGQGIAAKIAAIPNRNVYAQPATPQVAAVGGPGGIGQQAALRARGGV